MSKSYRTERNEFQNIHHHGKARKSSFWMWVLVVIAVVMAVLAVGIPYAKAPLAKLEAFLNPAPPVTTEPAVQILPEAKLAELDFSELTPVDMDGFDREVGEIFYEPYEVDGVVEMAKIRVLSEYAEETTYLDGSTTIEMVLERKDGTLYYTTIWPQERRVDVSVTGPEDEDESTETQYPFPVSIKTPDGEVTLYE